ncbi:MAG: glycosyltransferase [Pseudomonadota bacterium]
MTFSRNDNITELNVVIPVSERHDDLDELIREYHAALSASVANIDYTVILDGDYPDSRRQLEEVAKTGIRLRVVQLARHFGESNALAIGFEQTTADFVLTLPAYRQVNAEQLPEVLEAIADCDMVAARRWPRHDSGLNQWMTRAFHGVIRAITRYDFRDMGCGVRLIRRRVLEEVHLYGDQHRFLPMLAAHRGFTVREKSINQSALESRVRVYRPGVYFTRLLDVITVFFLTRFTKKPLRFFGMVGGGLSVIGGIVLLLLFVQRAFFGVALGDRPALVVATLFVVLGAQLIALGLVGELVIFTNARSDKEYTIAEMINFDASEDVAPVKESTTLDAEASARQH